MPRTGCSALCVLRLLFLIAKTGLIFHDHLLIIQLGKQLDKLEFGGQFDKNIVGATNSRPRAADCRPYNTG